MYTTPTTAAAVFLAVATLSAGPGHAQAPVAPDAVLVSNSRASVLYEDLTAELERLPEENRLEFLLSKERVATVLENLLVTKVMAAEALQSGLQKQPRVAAEIRNQTERVLTKYRREEVEAKAPKIDLLPLAREIFLTRMKGLERPAMYTSWHTLIKTKDRTLDAARERAKMVKAKLDVGGKPEDLAKEYSDDESVSINTGYIQATSLNYLDRNFGDALEKLKVGESALVETEYGVHVVRLLKVVPRIRPAFEDVKAAMLEEADKTYKQRVLDAYLTKIRADPTIKLNTAVLDQMRPKLPEVPPPPSPSGPLKR